MRKRKTTIGNCTRGQAMVETALMLPLLLALILNIVNFGYFFLVAVNVTAAPRSAVQYSVLGFATPAALGSLPAASPATTVTSVGYLAYSDITGGLYLPANAKVQICSKSVGTSGTAPNIISSCVTCTSQSSCSAGGTLAPSPDPENSTFVLNRVDLTYTFTTLIPGSPFNIALLSVCPSGSCTFHRQVSMRAMD